MIESVGRGGVKLEDVATAIKELKRIGKNPTVANIRQFIGYGSLSTICKHMKTLKSPESRPLPSGTESDLSRKLTLATAVLRTVCELSAEWPEALNGVLRSDCNILTRDIAVEFNRAVRKHSRSNDPNSQNPVP